MNKKIIIFTILGLLILILMSIDSIKNSVVSFLLAGVIPGTKTIVPSWAMIALWCVVTATLATSYIETIIGPLRSHTTTDKIQSRMPRRRYSQL